jgi:hypothetical protein
MWWDMAGFGFGGNFEGRFLLLCLKLIWLVVVNMFTYFIYFKDFYKCCILNAICKRNAAKKSYASTQRKVHSGREM